MRLNRQWKWWLFIYTWPLPNAHKTKNIIIKIQVNDTNCSKPIHFYDPRHRLNNWLRIISTEIMFVYITVQRNPEIIKIIKINNNDNDEVTKQKQGTWKICDSLSYFVFYFYVKRQRKIHYISIYFRHKRNNKIPHIFFMLPKFIVVFFLYVLLLFFMYMKLFVLFMLLIHKCISCKKIQNQISPMVFLCGKKW